MLLPLIRKWLKKRLDIHLSIIPEYFFEATKDGSLLAQVLHHYHVITAAELQLVEETRDSAVAFENYNNHIREWLGRIGMELTESDIHEITNTEGTAAASVFYEVYMKLENKQGSVHLAKTRQHHFKIQKVSEYEMEDVFIEANPLCEPLIKQWDVINWERDHLAAIMMKYLRSREEYDQYLQQKTLKELASPAYHAKLEDTLVLLKAEKTDYTYEELIEQQKAALEMEQFQPNTDEARRIMKQIKKRNKQRAERAAFRLELQHELLAEVWKRIGETEEQEFDKVVCEKLLKQSKHEKEIAEKLLAIRQHKEEMIQNRKIQDEIDQKRRDEEFIRRLFEESLEERMKFHEERMALIEEHKRLYAEKMRLKALKHQKLCREIMDDIVDIALKTAEYKEMYGVEPDKYVKRNWATLFIKQQPIFDLVVPLQDLAQPPEDTTEELEEIFRREIKRQDTLDEQDLYDYIHFRNIWMIEEGLEDFMTPMELGMNCLGYVVHKLLLKKYPLPIPQKPELSSEIEISACTNNMTDLSRLDFLQRLLDLKSVKVIQMEDATNFCIKAYETELKTEYDDPFPEEEYLREVTPKKAKSQKGLKKGKKGKKGSKKSSKKSKSSKSKKSSKKSKKSKGSKKSKKGKKGKKGASKTEVAVPVLEEKQAQTPRLFPWEKIVFSNKARLGRIAKGLLGQEEVISDKLLVDMFVEYLMSLKDIKGWVLVNYPNNYEQAALLEQALSGKPVPKEYYDKNLNGESLTSIQVDEEQQEEQEEDESIFLSDAHTLDAILDELRTENLPADRDEAKMSVRESQILGHRRFVTQSVSQVSELSSITILDDWNVNPEERVKQLLPDLKGLAYSSEEEKDESDKEEATKTCICVCNVPQNETDRPGGDEQGETGRKSEMFDDFIPDGEEPPHEEYIELDELPKSGKPDEQEGNVNGTTEDGQSVEKAVEEPKECVCYLNNADKDGGTAEVQEEKTQTEILGLEVEVGGPDDKPIERVVAEDVYEEKRLSKIVPNPRPLEKEEYSTVLTAYVRILEKEEEDDENEEYPIPVFKELERKDGLEKFYCDQGCFYVLQYEEFNSDTIKCLAKMIIGDYSLPWKTSVEIFGDRYKEAMLEVGDHKITKKGKKGKKGKKKKKKKKGKGSKSDTKTSGKSSKKSKGKKSKGSKGKKSKGSKGKKSSKSSKSKKSGKSKKGKKGKKGKHKDEHEEVGHEDKEVQVPSVEEVEEEELPEPRAGEPDWEYVNLPIPAEVELAIATLWDNFETNYVKNFKDLFFNKRILLYDVVPFLAKTRDTMNDFIVRPDQKQYYLREFQKTLNDIDLELRNDPETKSELFCRIDEFKEKLLGICDAKMQESEEERRNFIRQNWLYHQFCQMTNNSAIAFQLEVDRLVDTLQFLSDYYIAVIIKSIKEGYEFHKVLLPKYECDDKQSEKFNNLFVEIDSVNDDRTEFHKYIEESKNMGLAFLESMKPLALKPLNDMKKIFDPKAKEKKEKKKKKAKKTGSKGHVKKFEPDEDVKENADRIFEEWQCAINGEIARMNVHLNIIRNEAFNRFDDVILWIKRIFEEIYDNISIRYENELASVHKACELLLQSVEQEVIIHPELTFEGDQLAQIQVMLFPESLEVPEEDHKEGAFKIEQIEYMVKVLFDLAHTGYIMRKTFLLLIQDILYQDDIEEETDTPKLWRNLSTSTLNALLKRLFDDEKYLYWKDFIVCNLMIPFPTREQLMEVRRQFREYDSLLTERVTREEYDTITFWFEEQEDVQLDRLKSIIYKMYQTDENEFNWTAMLLDFCKDEDPVAGFVKALELSLGKFICYDEETGRTFVSDILEDRILFERQQKEHEETVLIAKKAVSLLIDKILDECEGPEGFALTEVVDQERTSFQSSRDREKSLTSKVSEPYEEPEEGKIVTEHKFSYAKIGFEARDNTAVAYFLPLELVLVIIGTEVSWNLELDNVEGGDTFKDKIVEIYEGCRNEKFNDIVLSHEFLNCEPLRELFKTTTKFSVHNPIKLVKRILYDKPDSAVDPEEFVTMENGDGSENISETEED